MRPIVIYHAGCADGFCAAWVARASLGKDCDFVPAHYGDAPPDVSGMYVCILDFSYKRNVMRQVIAQAEFVVVLDHHQTAQAELAGLAEEISREGGSWEPVIQFDMDKSGGRLAWEYFFAKQMASPWLVDYTEDRDLWRHALPYSREVNACLRSHPMDFDLWDAFAVYDRETAIAAFLVEGTAILRSQQQIVDHHVRVAHDVEFDGLKGRGVNATVLASEIAGELARGLAFGACYFDRADGARVWSLRSAPDGADVSEIAKRRGGGGHRHAAGFTVGGA